MFCAKCFSTYLRQAGDARHDIGITRHRPPLRPQYSSILLHCFTAGARACQRNPRQLMPSSTTPGLIAFGYKRCGVKSLSNSPRRNRLVGSPGPNRYSSAAFTWPAHPFSRCRRAVRLHIQLRLARSTGPGSSSSAFRYYRVYRSDIDHYYQTLTTRLPGQ